MELKGIFDIRVKIEKAIASYISDNRGNPENSENIGYINPASDVYVDGDRQLIFIETPGMTEDSVKIEVYDDNLVFSADKKIIRNKGRKYIQMERKLGAYVKHIPLSFKKNEIVSVRHTYKLGVIKIEIDKVS